MKRFFAIAILVAAAMFASATDLNATGDTLVARVITNCASAPCRTETDSNGITATADWTPALEPITMFLGGTGLMGLVWGVWRRRLFSGPQPIAGQTIVQDSITTLVQ